MEQEIPEGDSRKTILILDYGSQYTQLIARRVRELGYLSVLLPGDCSCDDVQNDNPGAIVLSGGPNSVFVEGAPGFPQGLKEYVASKRIPMLGICYGMQLIVKEYGGEVHRADQEEYGHMLLDAIEETPLFNCLGKQRVWMSHGDSAKTLPEGFKTIAVSEKETIVAIENRSLQIYGLQYHPEVTHTEKGTETIGNFIQKIAKLEPNWSMADVLTEQVALIKTTVPAGEHVICALSGGVDSTVAACLVHKAIGDRLHCVFVDNGLLRYQESKRVMHTFNEQLHLPVQCINAADRFLSSLKGISDPEKKRKTIGGEFIKVFQEFANSLGDKLGHIPKFLVQGTLYPDVIESCPPPGSNQKHSRTIKSHHNVGGLPEDMKFSLIEPLKALFKDEVRRLGSLLEVPNDFLSRHPFPGPGLGIRVLGDVTESGALDTLRQADEIFVQSIKEAGLYDDIWQAFAVFIPQKTVGVQGDERTHRFVIALRAISSSDGMTADWYSFSTDFLRSVSTKICNSVRDVNRVVYDITSKPPATVEWE